MKTDLEKFQKFFDKMNIKNHMCTCTDEEKSYMWIDDIHLAPNYAATLKIIFNGEGKFVEFETWGE